MAAAVFSTPGTSVASSQPLERQVLVKLEGHLVPQVDVVRPWNLLQTLQYKLANQTELPKDTYQDELTYFFPVFSLSGFI